MRKTLIIILTLLILLSTAWYFYAKNHQVAPGVPSITDFGAFFPIGQEVNPNPDEALNNQSSKSQNQSNSPFKRLSAGPVAGFSSFVQKLTTTIPADPAVPKSKPTKQTTTKHLIRYVSRGNGYVYEVEGDNLPLQVTNVYIPNIYEAMFGNDSNTALLRFLRADNQTIATFTVPVPILNPDGTRTQKQGVYFPDNIKTLAISPSGNQVARIVSNNDNSFLRITNLIDTKNIDLLKTTFSDWLLSWPTDNSLYLQTKASTNISGFLYKVNTKEKKLRRILGDINGLTTSVSPDGNYIIYSQTSSDGFITRILNTKNNSIMTLNLSLLPEKCAWLSNNDLICAGNSTIPKGQYPDDWYKGLINFSDKIYRIYTTSATYDTLYDGSVYDFDATNLSVDEDLKTLYFIDKTSGYLWQMKY